MWIEGRAVDWRWPKVKRRLASQRRDSSNLSHLWTHRSFSFTALPSNPKNKKEWRLTHHWCYSQPPPYLPSIGVVIVSQLTQHPMEGKAKKGSEATALSLMVTSHLIQFQLWDVDKGERARKSEGAVFQGLARPTFKTANLFWVSDRDGSN